MKIAYIIEGLYNSGGMERVVSMKASWLAGNTPFEITIITFAQADEQKDFFPLHENVRRLKLLSGFSGTVAKTLKTDLGKWLAENPQDICISTYGREFAVLPKLKDGSKKIVEFHFTYDINKQWASQGHSRWYDECFGWIKTMQMKNVAKQYDKIVVLTKADEKKWNCKKVVQIYNPITVAEGLVSSCEPKIVIAVGRMDYLKGFDMLLDCWALVEKRQPGWELHIYGGGNTEPYEKQIDALGLRYVKLMGRTSDVRTALVNSGLYVLSSRSEGFSLVMIEAMSCGLPIVSFDCPSGPAEMVEDGVTGFLIAPVGNISEMAAKMELLMQDLTLRCEMGKASKRKSEKYTVSNIMQQWVGLFDQVVYEA